MTTLYGPIEGPSLQEISKRRRIYLIAWKIAYIWKLRDAMDAYAAKLEDLNDLAAYLSQTETEEQP